MAEDLVLDTAIRDWVLVPLSVVMVLIGVLRYFVSKLMRSHQAPDLKVVKEGFLVILIGDLASLDRFRRQVILRARNLRAAAGFIPAKSFRARKIYYTNETLTFAWVNFFFSGFVAAMDDTQRMMQMSGFGFDPSKSLGAEKDSIDIIQHEWALPKMEKRAEDVLKKLVK
ncbi:hypothetical protein BHE74_00004708 [Ensete ventricosum]|uniref:ER membrane protein complex subunit 3 n=1 Tax=Ensete ventricosum TaxID=4639 RepID=A0A426ZQK6_ENSVE|nr:hypothetical protein B296_00039764 [Ensete ventricosum]RWW22364.1 hypothetical protein GW17_00013441 [Ensete ventricosum]RWW86514.1 hypothetical protein BHE74_00004708 [Ensete ventricosum]RZR97624.1 hypothetical protein BHM03_00026853 [Ensete ventricosum]